MNIHCGMKSVVNIRNQNYIFISDKPGILKLSVLFILIKTFNLGIYMYDLPIGSLGKCSDPVFTFPIQS